MDTYKTIIIAGTVAVIAFAALYLFGPVKTVIEQRVGALTGPDIASLYLNWGGVRTWNSRMEIKQATTTVCAIQSPAATSSLSYAAIKINLASSTATIWNVAKSNTAFATTTAIGTAHSVVGSAQDFILASTSPAAGDALVFAPNQWLVVGVQAGVTSGDAAGTGFVPTGACQASFVEVY